MCISWNSWWRCSIARTSKICLDWHQKSDFELNSNIHLRHSCNQNMQNIVTWGQNMSANIEEFACISMGGLFSGVPPCRTFTFSVTQGSPFLITNQKKKKHCLLPRTKVSTGLLWFSLYAVDLALAQSLGLMPSYLGWHPRLGLTPSFPRSEEVSYSLIAFDERVTFWLQCVRSLPCACVYVALFSRRLAYNHYAIAHAYNAANAHAQDSDRARWSQKVTLSSEAIGV